MKTKLTTISVLVAVLTLTPRLPAAPMGTAFSYQGRLAESGAPAEGIYDLRFAIYDDPAGPGVVAGPLTNAAVAVSNGLFAVTLDFGVGVFSGNARWLEIGVRANGIGDFTTLSPRQPLAPAPYAIYAETAGTAATGGGGTSAGMGTVVFGTNISSLDWVTNIISRVDFSRLTISGASTNPANGTYVATATIADPTQPPPVDIFVWESSNGWRVYQDMAGDLGNGTSMYAVVRPGPGDFTARIIYHVSQALWPDAWDDYGTALLDNFEGHAPAPYGVITAQRTNNVSRYLSLRADGEAVGMVISGLSGVSVGGGVTAATLAGDGAGVSNVVPNAYAAVLANLNDARVPRGAVFKNMFLTPPMGLCTWPRLATSVSDDIVRVIADAFYTNHLVELGWRLIQLDGGWQNKSPGYTGGRGADGKLHWSASFPNPGETIKYLSDRGIALGLYHEMDGGNERMHLVGHMAEDAASFKEWGVVYLKLDDLGLNNELRFSNLAAFRYELDKLDYPLFILNGGWAMAPTQPYVEARSPLVVDAYRLKVNGDLYLNENPSASLTAMLNHFHNGMQVHTNYAGPGKYMDFDFLSISQSVGHSNIIQSAFSLWSIGPSVLLVDWVNDATAPYMRNREMIAIHQDPLCLPGGAIAQSADSEIWIRTLVNSDRAVCAVNKTSSSISPTITLASLGYVPGPNIYRKVYSVWDKRVLAYTTNSFTVSVPAYSANLLRVSK